MLHAKHILKIGISLVITVIGCGCADSGKKPPAQVPVAELQNDKDTAIRPKIKIAVIDFTNKSDFGDEKLGLAGADILTTELFKTGSFLVVERDQIKKVFQEQAMGMSGAVDPTTATQAGKLLGVSAIIVGSISQFGIQVKDQDYLLVKQRIMKAEATVEVRVIDVTTGVILYADSGTGEYVRKGTRMLLELGQEVGYDESLGRQALRSAITEFLDGLVVQLAATEWSARIAAVETGRVFVNAGKRSGLKVGDILEVEEPGEPIEDPQSNMIIGRTPGKSKGKMKIVRFFGEDGSVAIPISGSGFSTNDVVTYVRP
jgi:curli biogenesis system outer membrane secretion channel CsgG